METREIRIRVPHLGGELVSNLLGLAGLIAVVVAVGGLTGNPWWSVLVAGGILVVLSYVAAAGTASAAEPAGGGYRAKPAAGRLRDGARPVPPAEGSGVGRSAA